MCTVTFVPGSNSILLTSNRDEKHVRASALHPEVYEFESGRLLFPKDADAGGTWISVHENGNAIVFLNGGLVKHQPNPPYKRSRGLILLDLIDSANPFRAFTELDLQGIEPFTAVIWDDRSLHECRWDGSKKYSREMDADQPHIWSSVTLYTPEVISKREGWFKDWLSRNPSPTQDSILKFHQFTGDGDKHNDLRMDRDGETYTVSVTSMKLEAAHTTMHYVDLKTDQSAVTRLPIQKTTVLVK
ncbi:MAG: hypothetical protein EOO02_10745 [Chitinophagaceae bacterium]|nr:MAG: hypothetical protein EOO02_10745 [Chitinophagaceae bacterium]